jgi:hypothetical protein
MGMKTSVGFLRRYDEEIAAVLGCYDRLVVTGTLTEIAYPEAMDSYLYQEGFRAFDIGQFADPLRQRIRDMERGRAGQASCGSDERIIKSKFSWGSTEAAEGNHGG